MRQEDLTPLLTIGKLVLGVFILTVALIIFSNIIG